MESNTYTAFAPGRTTLNDHVDYWNGIGIGAALKTGITVTYTPDTKEYGPEDSIRLHMQSDKMRHVSSHAPVKGADRPWVSEVAIVHGRDIMAPSLDKNSDAKWTDMVIGAFQYLKNRGLPVKGGDIKVTSQIPMGGGVSSSAAMIVASMKAALAPFMQPYDLKDKKTEFLKTIPGVNNVVEAVMTEITEEVKGRNPQAAENLKKFFADLSAEEGLNYVVAMLAQKVEVNYVGSSCGRLDQMSCSLAKPGEMLKINFNDLTFEHLPGLPAGYDLVVVDSGQKHAIGDLEGPYYQRFQVPRIIFPALGINSIDEITDINAALRTVTEKFPTHAEYIPWVRHAYEESQRGEQMAAALKAGDMKTLATLMNKSHTSLSAKNSYDNSTKLIDDLVKTVVNSGEGAALAARITGGGGGGSVVMLAENSRLFDLCAKVHEFRISPDSGIHTAEPKSTGISFVEAPAAVLKRLGIENSVARSTQRG